MQDQAKIKEIETLLGDLTAGNGIYANNVIGTHYDYDRVLELLNEAAKVMTETARNPRPLDLPVDIPWSEKFADPNQKFDPYAYDGSMSPEDYEAMVAHRLEDQGAEC